MAIVTLKPNERYAFVGKTRSGKTSMAITLAGTYAHAMAGSQWEVWWLDTKGDKNDRSKLREWGFRNAVSRKDREESGGLPNAIYFVIAPIEGEGEDSVINQAQAIIGSAYKRRRVILVVDEYKEVVISDKRPGTNLQNVFQRGGGLDVGIIGNTQEPVYIPRQLLSQASHIALFNLTYDYDIEYVKRFNKTYKPPVDSGDAYGFYWSWVDGPNRTWSYYANQAEWYKDLRVVLPRSRMPSVVAPT